MTAIPAKLAEIIVEHLGVDPEKVTPEASLIDDLGCDSLDLVELEMSIEDAFHIQIDEDSITMSSTVADLAKLVPADA